MSADIARDLTGARGAALDAVDEQLEAGTPTVTPGRDGPGSSCLAVPIHIRGRAYGTLRLTDIRGVATAHSDEPLGVQAGCRGDHQLVPVEQVDQHGARSADHARPWSGSCPLACKLRAGGAGAIGMIYARLRTTT